MPTPRQKLVENNRGKEPISFIDGPNTANNPMGIHDAWARIYNYLLQRYQAKMHGQGYRNGVDRRGLP